MAENAPFFKFRASDWLAGSIRSFSLEAQGVFINVVAIIWRDSGLFVGDLGDLAQRVDPYGCRRVKGRTEEIVTILEELVEGGMISTDVPGAIRVKFLDQEITEINEFRARQSANARKRWSGTSVRTALTTDKIMSYLPAQDPASHAYAESKKYMQKRLNKHSKAPSTAALRGIEKDLHSTFGRHCLPNRIRTAVQDGMESALAVWGSRNPQE